MTHQWIKCRSFKPLAGFCLENEKCHRKFLVTWRNVSVKQNLFWLKFSLITTIRRKSARESRYIGLQNKSFHHFHYPAEITQQQPNKKQKTKMQINELGGRKRQTRKGRKKRKLQTSTEDDEANLQRQVSVFQVGVRTVGQKASSSPSLSYPNRPGETISWREAGCQIIAGYQWHGGSNFNTQLTENRHREGTSGLETTWGGRQDLARWVNSQGQATQPRWKMAVPGGYRENTSK